jgi:spore maturation protein CgeB
MSFKLLSLSSMYPGSIESFYLNNPDTKSLSYDDHCNLLINDTTEFAGSYTRNFRKLGIDAKCIISNDTLLQNKWKSERNLNSDRISDIVFEQINEFKPDILWIENMNFVNDTWLRKVRRGIETIKLIIAYHCAAYKKDLIARLKNADFIITCTPGLKESFEREGLKTYLVYHGFDNELLTRVEQKGATTFNNLVFSGSLVTGDGFHNDRIKMIENLLKEKIDLTLYVTLEKRYRIKTKQFLHLLSGWLKKLKLGSLTEQFPIFEYGKSPVKSYSDTLLRSNHSPLYGIDMYNLFCRSKIVLNLHTGVAGDYAGNMRMFEVTGVGSCLLTDNKKNMKDLFEIGKEAVVYDSTEDCIKKIKWLLAHDQERKQIALMGQKKTLEMHTVEKRCRSIIDIIKKELNVRNGD